MGESGSPRFSIVLPTYQRRDLVVSSVRALSDQVESCFEVIVVVDGSADGTTEALDVLDVPFELRVEWQQNAGAAAARNRGAGMARGEFVLFLDDDMTAAPDLLQVHDKAFASGADAVLGHIPLDPRAPDTFLSRGIARWADGRRERIASHEGRLLLSDLLTGQLSVRREVFAALGGFDEDFTRGGSFGGEDTDFGRRLLGGGYRVVFVPEAISYQSYAVTPRAYLRQWRQAGSADALYLRKHPDDAEQICSAHDSDACSNRWVVRPLARAPFVSAAACGIVRRASALLAERFPRSAAAGLLLCKARDLEYWRAFNLAGAEPRPRPLRVLCYHALSDLSNQSIISEYGVPGSDFRRQLKLLRRAGFTFVSPDEALAALRGERGLPRRPTLVTFDDCFVDLLTTGLPVLQDERVPAVAFAVAAQVGRSNTWDVALGAPELPLLDAEGLRRLEEGGVEIGVHGRTHCKLTTTSDAQLDQETVGARQELVALGLARLRTFAYPHGDNDARVRRAVAAAGYEAAFTVRPGRVRGGTDRMALRRIEVLRGDGVGLKFLAKVAFPLPPLRVTARRALGAVIARTRGARRG